MYVYMYVLKKMVYEVKPSDIIGAYPWRGFHYSGYRRHHGEDIVKVPVVINGADIKGYVDNFPMYTQADFVKFLPKIAGIKDDVVVKVVG